MMYSNVFVQDIVYVLRTFRAKKRNRRMEKITQLGDSSDI